MNYNFNPLNETQPGRWNNSFRERAGSKSSGSVATSGLTRKQGSVCNRLRQDYLSHSVIFPEQRI
jgi:hypothetical protein